MASTSGHWKTGKYLMSLAFFMNGVCTRYFETKEDANYWADRMQEIHGRLTKRILKETDEED